MSPEEKALLKRSLELSEENNKILKSMHRTIRTQRIISIIYWVFIVGGALGVYYIIEPYIDAIISAYKAVSQGLNSDSSSFSSYIDLLNQ